MTPGIHRCVQRSGHRARVHTEHTQAVVLEQRHHSFVLILVSSRSVQAALWIISALEK